MAAKKIGEKRREYQAVFDNELGKSVLADLRNFCFATKSTFDKCPYEMSRREGRREVFLQIMNMLKVDFEQYYDYEHDDLI